MFTLLIEKICETSTSSLVHLKQQLTATILVQIPKETVFLTFGVDIYALQW